MAIDPYVLLQDGIEDFLGELKREVFDKYDMMTVAEVSVPEDKVEQYTGENGLFSMVFDFTYTDLDVHRINGLEWKRPWTYAELKNRIMTSQEILQKHSWEVLTWKITTSADPETSTFRQRIWDMRARPLSEPCISSFEERLLSIRARNWAWKIIHSLILRKFVIPLR